MIQQALWIWSLSCRISVIQHWISVTLHLSISPAHDWHAPLLCLLRKTQPLVSGDNHTRGLERLRVDGRVNVSEGGNCFLNESLSYQLPTCLSTVNSLLATASHLPPTLIALATILSTISLFPLASSS